MQEGRKVMNLLTWFLLAVVVVLAGILAFELMNDDDESVTDTNNTEVVEVARDADRLSRIIENPTDFYGTRTIVEGEIQDVYNNRVFTVSDQTIGDELLVVTRSPLTGRQVNEGEELFEDNADVQVVGTIRELTIAEVEADYSIDLDEEIEAEFESRPVMIGELVQYADEDALFDFNQGIDEDR